MTVKPTFRELRKQKGLTLDQLAQLSGLKAGTVRAIDLEKVKQPIHYQTAAKLAELVGVKPENIAWSAPISHIPFDQYDHFYGED